MMVKTMYTSCGVHGVAWFAPIHKERERGWRGRERERETEEGDVTCLSRLMFFVFLFLPSDLPYEDNKAALCCVVRVRPEVSLCGCQDTLKSS